MNPGICWMREISIASSFAAPLTRGWFDRLGGMTIATTRLADGSVVTILSGELVDQSALVGVVNTLHDLGLPLISVERVAAESSNR